MVGMQMADQDHLKVGELGSRLSEADIGSATRIDEYLRLISDPEKIRGVGPILYKAGCAGTQDLNRHRTSDAALCEGAGRCRKTNEQPGNKPTNHECTFPHRARHR